MPPPVHKRAKEKRRALFSRARAAHIALFGRSPGATPYPSHPVAAACRPWARPEIDCLGSQLSARKRRAIGRLPVSFDSSFFASAAARYHAYGIGEERKVTEKTKGVSVF